MNIYKIQYNELIRNSYELFIRNYYTGMYTLLYST